MEVYVEKEKEIKKVGSELDTLKEILDWLEEKKELPMNVKLKMDDDEIMIDLFGESYEDLVNRRWDGNILGRIVLYRDCSPNGVIKEIK